MTPALDFAMGVRYALAMLIVWGKKIRRRPAGVAADFCPICREVTEVSVSSVSKIDHVYYIPLRGDGEHVADEVTCTGCGLKRRFPVGRIRPLPKGEPDVLEMALRTGPLSEEELTDRLELETRAGERNLAAEERLRLIAESILSMEYGYLAGRDKGIRASISAVLQLLMIVGILASIIMWSAWMNPIRPTATPPFPLWELVVSGLTAIIALVVIYRMIADHRAGARGNLGLLGRSLAPLKPEREELETALKALRARKVEFARNLSLSDVVAAVERG